LKSKDDNEMSPDEKWEEHLLTNVNKVENWRKEKIVIGPEPLLIPNETNGNTANTTIYADDNSATEEANTKEELKDKTEEMLNNLFSQFVILTGYIKLP
jgi:hypothetical protein